MPSPGFEPAIQGIKRIQTYALDSTATVISLPNNYWEVIFFCFVFMMKGPRTTALRLFVQPQ
jgi:hypothetical protein